MLYRLAEEQKKTGVFKPAKYFSIDRVFRNEAIDRTHLAEFHQIEGAPEGLATRFPGTTSCSAERLLGSCASGEHTLILVHARTKALWRCDLGFRALGFCLKPHALNLGALRSLASLIPGSRAPLQPHPAAGV